MGIDGWFYFFGSTRACREDSPIHGFRLGVHGKNIYPFILVESGSWIKRLTLIYGNVNPATASDTSNTSNCDASRVAILTLEELFGKMKSLPRLYRARGFKWRSKGCDLSHELEVGEGRGREGRGGDCVDCKIQPSENCGKTNLVHVGSHEFHALIEGVRVAATRVENQPSEGRVRQEVRVVVDLVQGVEHGLETLDALLLLDSSARRLSHGPGDLGKGKGRK